MEKNFSEIVDEFILNNKEEMIEELSKFISVKSVSRADLAKEGMPYGEDCAKMLDFALKEGERYGFRSMNHEGYCGSLYLDGKNEDEIGFVCHLDVVPEGENWIYEPYKMHQVNDYLIGRGVSDDKGPTILSLYVMKFFKEYGPLNHTLRLMMGVAEETGMDDFKEYFLNHNGYAPKFSIVSDCGFPVCYAQKGGIDARFVLPKGSDILSLQSGLVRNAIPDKATTLIKNISYEEAKALFSESEGFKVLNKESGVLIEATGKAGHAAAPQYANNALVKLAKKIVSLNLDLSLEGFDAIAKLFDTPYGDGMDIHFSDSESGELTINAGVASSNDENIFVEIDIRYPISANSDQIIKNMEDHLKKFNGKMVNLNVAKPYYIPKDDQKVKALMEVYQEVTKDYETKPYSMGGGTYSRVVPNAMSFGPGLIHGHHQDFLPEGHGGAHSKDEVLNITDWLEALKIYILAIKKLDDLDL